MRRLALAAAAAGATLVGWGLVESRALRLQRLELELDGLPPELDGLRVLHVSDVHAGYGPGLALLRRVVDWAERERPELVAVTGDLVARASAEARFRQLAARLGACAEAGAYAVLGNHDHAVGNDPFAQGGAISSLDGVELLGDDWRTVALRGRRICVAGTDAYAYLHDSAYRPGAERDPSADLRILLCHYPDVLSRLPRGSYQLVLAGHLHGGQICIPWGGGRVSLAHPRSGNVGGVEHRDGTTMHVSAGIGTTFLPLRILAPPEATLLVLRPAARPHPGAILRT